jgi:hypothetical protein
MEDEELKRDQIRFSDSNLSKIENSPNSTNTRMGPATDWDADEVDIEGSESGNAFNFDADEPVFFLASDPRPNDQFRSMIRT